MQVLLYAIRHGDWEYLFANILNTPGTPFPADEIVNIQRLDTTNENYKNLEFIVEYIPLDNVLS